MKILTPINNANEVLPLIEAGAGEFYCGFVPPEWWRRYGFLFCLNRREFKEINVRSYEKLGKLIRKAHKFTKKIFLTFNATFYPGEVLPLMRKIIERTLSLGVDGLIVADLGLLLKLNDWGIKTEIILSGEFGLTNGYAINLLKGLNIKRIIFQRFLPIDSMKKIISSYPEFEYEAFVMNEKCPFGGSYCFSVHGKINETFCGFMMRSMQQIVFTKPKNYIYFKKALENLHADLDNENAGWLHRRLHSGIRKRSPKILPAVACGLCAIYSLRNIGIKVLKIVGRGNTLETRLLMVRLVNNVLSHNYNYTQMKKMYSRAFMNYYKEQCDLKCKCYY